MTAATLDSLTAKRLSLKAPASDTDLLKAVQDGLSPGALDGLRKHGFSPEEIYRLVAPRTTLLRRQAGKLKLSTDESDRAARLARIHALATQTLGDQTKANHWLREPAPGLSGTPVQTPLDLLATEAGARHVEERLLQIAYGLYA